MNKPQTKVIVGLPVYNGERFIRRAIDSVLSQTFSDFELIISDNASTDLTPRICKEYMNKDKRVKFIQQKENKGGTWNFFFLLDLAKSDYFIWLDVDDYFSPYFLEKNINVLESNKNIIASVGKMEPFGPNYDNFKINLSDKLIKKGYKKIRQYYRPHYYSSVSGSYEKRIGSCLRHSTYYLFIYALFRTEILHKALNILWDENMFGIQNSLISLRYEDLTWAEENIFARQIPLISLQFGGIHVVDEVLSYRYTEGIGSGQNKNIIKEYRKGEVGFKNMFFSKAPFIKWCWKSLGKKVFLKNIDYFIRLSLGNTNFALISLIRYGISHKN